MEPNQSDSPFGEDLATHTTRLLVRDYVLTPDWLVTTVLQLAGVGPSFRENLRTSPSIGYTVPARPVDSLGPPVWQVTGLLPVLAVSLAVAAQTQQHARCTWCGKPAAIGKRRPRTNQPWYGDHASCRALARAKTMNLAEDKRALKRKRATAHPDAAGDGAHSRGDTDLPPSNAG
jgi:hypothetical protein